MASAPAWLLVQDVQFSLLAAPRAVQSSLRKVKSSLGIFVLPQGARLTASSDFARATKSGVRVTTQHFVGYLYISPLTNNDSAKCGLIINKTVGGSVKRHRLARKIRHAVAPHIASLPTGSLLVIRALKEDGDRNVSEEILELINKLSAKSAKVASR
jgi:ribonuclease P protein component